MDLIVSYLIAFVIFPPKRLYDAYMQLIQGKEIIGPDTRLSSWIILGGTVLMLLLVVLANKQIKWYKTIGCWYVCLFLIVVIEFIRNFI